MVMLPLFSRCSDGNRRNGYRKQTGSYADNVWKNTSNIPEQEIQDLQHHLIMQVHPEKETYFLIGSIGDKTYYFQIFRLLPIFFQALYVLVYGKQPMPIMGTIYGFPIQMPPILGFYHNKIPTGKADHLNGIMNVDVTFYRW